MINSRLVTLYGDIEEMTPGERELFFLDHPELLGWFRTVAKIGKRLFKRIGRRARSRRKKRRRKKKLVAQRRETALIQQQFLIARQRRQQQQQQKKKQQKNLMIAAAVPLAAMFLLGK